MAVRFAVRLLRHRGRVLPWREVVNRPPLVGDLRIEEIRDEELRRYLRTALLSDDFSVRPAADRPCLFDVHIVGMSPQAFSLTGFERVDGAEYAQSWLVQPIANRKPAAAIDPKPTFPRASATPRFRGTAWGSDRPRNGRYFGHKSFGVQSLATVIQD